MSTTLEPREVDRPFLRRWLMAAVELLLRAPIRFGLIIALIGVLDTSAVNVVRSQPALSLWLDRCGIVALPIVFVLVSAIARGVDDAQATWSAISQLKRGSVWMGALAAGLLVASVTLFLATSLRGAHDALVKPAASHYWDSGQFAGSMTSNIVLLYVFTGLCFYPLLVFAPTVPVRSIFMMSRTAADLNGGVVVAFFVAAVAITADALALVFPAFGMTTAVFIVFLGIFNYVAYRDIFERRADNRPAPSAVTPLNLAAQKP